MRSSARIATLGVLAVAALIAGARPGNAQAERPGTLRVKIELRAAGNDAVDVCRYHDLTDGEARSLARAVARALERPNDEIIYDPEIAAHCGVVDPVRALHEADPTRRYGRRFTVRTGPLLDAARAAGARELRLEICTPVARVDRVGPSPDEGHLCEWRGWGWLVDEPGEILVRFWATPSDVRTATAATSLAMGGLFMLIGFAALRGGRGMLVGWLRRHRVIGMGSVVLAVGATVVLWVVLAYETRLVHSLQLVHGMDEVGEMLLVWGLMGVAGAGVVGAAAMAVARHARLHPDPDAEPLPQELAPSAVRWRPVPILLMALMAVPMLLMDLEATTAPIIILLLAFATVAAVLGPTILGLVVTGMATAERTSEGDAVLSGLRSLGLRVSRLMVSEQPLRHQDGAPAGVVRAGSSVLIWRRVFELPTGEAVGAVALAAWPMLSVWFLTLMPIGFAIAQDVTTPEASVPIWLYVVAIATALGRELLRVAERRTIAGSLRTSMWGADALRGLIRLWRMEADLVLSWTASGRLKQPRRGPRRRTPSIPTLEDLRADAVEGAYASAASAGLDPATVEHAADQAWPIPEEPPIVVDGP